MPKGEAVISPAARNVGLSTRSKHVSPTVLINSDWLEFHNIKKAPRYWLPVHSVWSFSHREWQIELEMLCCQGCLWGAGETLAVLDCCPEGHCFVQNKEEMGH